MNTLENKKTQIDTLTKAAEQEWENLTLASNFIFCKVMMNKELCKKVLSEILGEEVERVEYPEYEKVIQARYDSKSVRLDVYIKGDDTVYNIEMQNIKKDSIPKRGRYYQDLIDLDLLEKGAYYKNLNKSIVIFICTFDLYDLGYYKYTFTNRCIEVPDLEYGDETTKIIVNTYGTKGDVSEELKVFLNAVNGRFSNSEFSDKIKEEIDRVKRSDVMKREYLAMYFHEEDIREQSLAQGELKATKEHILTILNKLGDLSESIKTKIEAEEDISVLDNWFELALEVSSVDEFVEKM